MPFRMFSSSSAMIKRYMGSTFLFSQLPHPKKRGSPLPRSSRPHKYGPIISPNAAVCKLYFLFPRGGLDTAPPGRYHDPKRPFPVVERSVCL